MAISTNAKLDFLWKKLIYGVSKTDSDTAKAGNNETIASPTIVTSANLWTQASSTDIPSTPPVTDTAAVKLYRGANRVACTADVTSGAPAARPTYLTGIINWVPPTFGASYAVEVYGGDPVTTGVRLFPGTTNEEWVFDYASGSLHFPTNIPAAASNGIYIRGYAYVGTTGVPTVNGPTGATGPVGPTGPGGVIALYKENPGSYTTPNAGGTNAIAVGNGAYSQYAGGLVHSAGVFSSLGDAQVGNYILRNTTTDLTLTELYLNGIGDKLILPTNTTWAFTATVVGHMVGTSKSCHYIYHGTVRKDATSASTRLLNINKVVLAKDDLSWDIIFGIETLNGAIRLRVQGGASQTIRWVAKITTVEVGG